MGIKLYKEECRIFRIATGHIENKICDNGLYREMGVWLILRKGRGLNIEGWWHISKRVHA